MSQNAAPEDDLTNELWLLGRVAELGVKDAVAATVKVDELLKRALNRDADVQDVAARSFLDPALVRHVRDGGNSFQFYLDSTVSGVRD